jgi:hypothetical protein
MFRSLWYEFAHMEAPTQALFNSVCVFLKRSLDFIVVALLRAAAVEASLEGRGERQGALAVLALLGGGAG